MRIPVCHPPQELPSRGMPCLHLCRAFRAIALKGKPFDLSGPLSQLHRGQDGPSVLMPPPPRHTEPSKVQLQCRPSASGSALPFQPIEQN